VISRGRVMSVSALPGAATSNMGRRALLWRGEAEVVS
jgi:hypothetical protein